MPGTKGRSGGSRAGAGTFYKRLPDPFASLGIELGEPHTMYILDWEVGGCSVCGSRWWDSYTVVCQGIKQESNKLGDSFPILAEVKTKGQLKRHKRNCPNK